jgi:hypothetical protein
MSTDQSIVRYALVPNKPGYRVGTDGSVWTCLGQIGRGRGGGKGARYGITGVWRKLSLRGNRYVNVNLSGSMYAVHRLVLEAFVGPCPEEMEACHYPDPDKKNNNLNNLRWDTHDANVKDSMVLGLLAVGEKNNQTPFTADQVREIRRRHGAGGTSYRKLAAEYGVSWNTIRYIVKRRYWKHI